MKVNYSFLLVLLVAQLVLCPWTQASVVYTPPSAEQGATISGDVAATGVGRVVGNGSVSFRGDRVSLIFANVDLTAKQPTLTGTTFRTRRDHDRVTGLIFFDGGTDVAKLDGGTATDTVKTLDGGLISGRIKEVTGGQMRIETDGKTKTIDCSQIVTVSSSRVFHFQTSLTGTSVTFTKTGRSLVTASVKQTATTTSSKSGRSVKRAIIVILAVCLIATAIAVPVAVGVATHHHSNNNNLQQQAILFNLLRGRSTASALPVVASGP